VCGLIRNFQPGLTPAQVAAHLVATGDAVNFDHPIGPKVNAFNAVNPALLAVATDAAPARLGIQGSSPNPFRDRTTLQFSTAGEGPARLALYDCAGRRVRVLVEQPLPAGRHAVQWNGAGEDGRPLAGGIYFARLESAGRSVQTKLVRLGR